MLITLSATSSICFAGKKFASWLFVMTHNAIYFTWATWLVWQNANMLVWLRPSFTSECVQTLFFDKGAGRVWKIWCLRTRLVTCRQWTSCNVTTTNNVTNNDVTCHNQWCHMMSQTMRIKWPILNLFRQGNVHVYSYSYTCSFFDAHKFINTACVTGHVHESVLVYKVK